MGIIAWNIPNMLTIILMAVVGYLVLAVLAQGLMMVTGAGAGVSQNQGAPVFRWMSNLGR